MKYKVGQWVKLYPLSYYKNNPNYKVTLEDDNAINCMPISSCYINQSMLPLLGKSFKIKEVTSYYYIFFEAAFHYEDWMIETPFESMIDFFKGSENENNTL